MNSWITTSELIDELRVGEVAELHSKWLEGMPDFAYDAVTKNEGGDIVWCMKDESSVDNKSISLKGTTINFTWRILLNYVCFNEALDAMNGGARSVVLHTFDGFFTFSQGQFHSQELGAFTLKELYESKWTIEW